jgi:transcriptional regulator with XRE-family HTH domain
MADVRQQHEPEFDRLVEQESLILEATETICQLMEELGVTRAALAERTGTSKGYITQLLSGRRNMTLRTLADLAYALEHRLTFQAVSRSVGTATDLPSWTGATPSPQRGITFTTPAGSCLNAIASVVPPLWMPDTGEAENLTRRVERFMRDFEKAASVPGAPFVDRSKVAREQPLSNTRQAA